MNTAAPLHEGLGLAALQANPAERQGEKITIEELEDVPSMRRNGKKGGSGIALDPFQSLFNSVRRYDRRSRGSTRSSNGIPSEPKEYKEKRIFHEVADLRKSNIRLKARLTSLLNLTNLLHKAPADDKALDDIKADALTFSSLLDSSVLRTVGPSPLDAESDGGAVSKKDDDNGKSGNQRSVPILPSANPDLLGGNDNACTSEALNFFRGIEIAVEREYEKRKRAEIEEAEAWKDQFEKNDIDRRGLIRRVKVLEAQVRSQNGEIANARNGKQLTTIKGFESYVTEDDAALIALGVEPVDKYPKQEKGALVLLPSPPRLHNQREIEIVKRERDSLSEELVELRSSYNKAAAATKARECDISALADRVEEAQQKLLASEREKVELKRQLNSEKGIVQKLRTRERSFEKSALEARELSNIAVEKAEATLVKAAKLKVARRKPLIRAKRAAIR